MSTKIATVKCPTVQNVINNGRSIPDQYIIYGVDVLYKMKTYTGTAFQSYNSIIAFISSDGSLTLLDEDDWDCSSTTSRYRNMFLGYKKTETLKKIKSGEIKLALLNR